MFLKHKTNGDLVEVLDMTALFDPSQAHLKARFHAGEEMPEADDFAKADLLFPSGEAMPRCWVDRNYKA
ncbi:MAG: acetyltransferase [Gammaproteobacteria bacterium]|nr:acetyltransferase [Gammaproteobacteria bacterium]